MATQPKKSRWYAITLDHEIVAECDKKRDVVTELELRFGSHYTIKRLDAGEYLWQGKGSPSGASVGKTIFIYLR